MTPQEIEQLRAHADAFADGYSGHFGIRLRDARWQKVRDTHMAALVLERAAKVCDVTPPEPFRPSIEAAHALRNMAKGMG